MSFIIECARWSVSCLFQLWNVYIKNAFLKSLECKITAAVIWQSPIKFVIRCPPECEPISSLDCSLDHRAALGWWYASLKYRWVMWVTNHLQRFHRTLSGFKGQVTWTQTSDTLWIFKKEPHQSAAAAAAAVIVYSPLLRCVMHSLLIDFRFWRYFSPVCALQSCTYHSSLRLTSLSITLMLLLRWHPIRNCPEKQKRTDYFTDMLLLKRIVLHLSMVFCLTGFVCQLAFVRARQKPSEGKEEKYGGETTTLSSLPDAHLPPRRDKRKSQRVHTSEIIFPHSSPHISSVSCSPAWQICSHEPQRGGGERTDCSLQLLGEQLNE